jgi:hypothetical protein
MSHDPDAQTLTTTAAAIQQASLAMPTDPWAGSEPQPSVPQTVAAPDQGSASESESIAAPRLELQAQRDERVRSVHPVPTDVTLPIGRSIVFTAIAKDASGATVGGVIPRWRAFDAENQQVYISHQGEFTARYPGTFRITVETGDYTAETFVTVPEGSLGGVGLPTVGDGVLANPEGIIEPSAADSTASPQTVVPTQPSVRRARREDTEPDTAFLPRNRRGRNPIHSSVSIRRDSVRAVQEAEDAGSRNFRQVVPVLHLPGRGLDLMLDLFYNSRVWHKDENRIIFDVDGDWPVPGWTLGFGKIAKFKKESFGFLYSPEGTRHPFYGTADFSGNTWVARNYTRDGTFIDYSITVVKESYDLISAQAKQPDGTIVDFTALDASAMALYATRITDANGNYITIGYRNNTAPQIEAITDTLGRTVTFWYDINNLLTAITGPGLNQTTRELIRLHYRELLLNYAFAEGCQPYTGEVATTWVIDAIYYPGSGMGYWFGDADSYSSYGMIAKFTEQRAMTIVANSLEEQGIITPGLMTRNRVYNYPLEPDPTLTDHH